jgi:NDP-sugar pyrophosphorylase family protein
MSRMKAIILAGGKATRLYPTTLIMPKQLIMIDGYPVIHYVLRHCLDNGVKEVIICLSDRTLKTEFSHALEGRYADLDIDYSVSPGAFGTSGRILAAARTFDDRTFITYYGDLITSFSLRDMIAQHTRNRKKPICTLAVTDSKEMEFGVAGFESDSGRISSFVERPKMRTISSFKVNVGISVCNRDSVGYCAESADFYGDTIPAMLSGGETVCGYTVDEFIDVGTFSSIEKARTLLAHSRRKRATREPRGKTPHE